MHRWFFADDELLCKDTSPPPGPSTSKTTRTSSTDIVSGTDWRFKVKFDWNLCSNETLAICGNCPSLGNWDPQFSLPLTRNDDCFWTLTVCLPRESNVRYRYLVVAINYGGKKIVRFWETHFEARVIRRDQAQGSESTEYETFGILNNKFKIERGWLNHDVHVVQFKFYRAPFVLKSNYVQLLLRLKITPIKIKISRKCENVNPTLQSATSEPYKKFSNENIGDDDELRQSFAYCEVASLQNRNGEFCKQPPYGTPCGPDDLLMFNVTLSDIEHTAYLIDLYNYSPKSTRDELPNHFGYQYVLPRDLKNSEGTLDLAIMCGARHRPLGSMICDYLIVKPIQSHAFSLEKTFQRHWNMRSELMYIGHRGCGKSFWWQSNILRENTIYSLNLAVEHGADMVEFDVQLTKDMVPILWHDFQVHVSNKINIDLPECDIMHLPLTSKEIVGLKSSGHRVGKYFVDFPLSGFTLEQLRRVRVYEPSKETTCIFDNKRSNRPFPTLEEVFKEVDCKAGFVIDIKWPEKVANYTKREFPLSDFDKNKFIDAVLDVVLKNAGTRRIVFSSFDADICTMIRLKQNLYPAMFLILPRTSKKQFIDPRGKSISTAIYFAKAMEFLGLHVHSSDLLETPRKVSEIHEHDQCIFSWGEDNRDEETRKYLRRLGVNGIIYGRINHALKPVDLQKSVFYIDPLKRSSKC